jgi:hypothetical protein
MPETSVIVGARLAVHFFVGLGRRAASALPLTLIHRSAWKEFSEVSMQDAA